MNLVVKDIKKTQEFLLIAFPEWKTRGSGTSDWYGRERSWVHIGNDDNYITLNNKAEGDNRDLKGYTFQLLPNQSVHSSAFLHQCLYSI